MISIVKLSDITKNEYSKLINRFGDDFTNVMIDKVIPIVNDVKNNGDNAVRKYTEMFDGVKIDNLMASEEEITEGYKTTPQNVIDAFKQAKENIIEFHSKQKRENISYSRPDFGELGVVYQPIQSAGIYVPGGKASYPSSVLMGVIPAQIAGVEDITVITPPMKNGKVNSAVLAMCKLLGIKNILKSGGAQGIAAAGWGTESVIKSNIIVGPGNIFVTAAKSYLFSLGSIQIDSLAGPSEVLIAADKSANPKWVAWDMLSQAEHEENAMAVLVTDSDELAQKTAEHIKQDILSGRGRSEIKKKALENSIIIVCNNFDEVITFSNEFAAEHMELMIDDPMKYLSSIKNVGSLFLGHYSPVSIGDYYSGTNHILPTGGASRFSSGLSVETFYRRTTYQNPTKSGLKQALAPVTAMSEFEGFDDKHGDSISIRFHNN